MARPSALFVAFLCVLALVVSAGHAHAGKRKRGRSNMPPGWAWPPTAVMKRAGRNCLSQLDDLGVRWKKSRSTPKVVTPIELPRLQLGDIELVSVYRKPPFVMDCHLAAALAAQAPALYNLGVREIHFSSIYRNTRVRTGGKQRRALSRHALGLAIDVWQIVDDAGVVHSIEEDYPNDDELLLAVERTINESGAFRMVLTPANDPASHDDHFHFEARVDYEKVPPAPQARRKPVRRGDKARASRRARR